MLVHVCCAPDALYVMGLLGHDYQVSGFFYNPNIHPRKEYIRRLKEAQKVFRILGFPLIEGPYEDARWFHTTEKHRHEPERGRRCDICYGLRLAKTAEKAAAEGFEFFATVMSLSPWKKAQAMNRMGKMFARRYKLSYLEADFKKKDGFKKSVELSKKHHLYRQDYCGCVYSMKRRKDEQR